MEETTLILQRILFPKLTDRILGVLSIKDKMSCKRWYTLELPDRQNKTNISCIPVGTYQGIKHISPKFDNCIKLLDVVNRTDILIHSGNSPKDTKGCILIGSAIENNNLVRSRVALQDLLLNCSNNITLLIENS